MCDVAGRFKLQKLRTAQVEVRNLQLEAAADVKRRLETARKDLQEKERCLPATFGEDSFQKYEEAQECLERVESLNRQVRELEEALDNNPILEEVNLNSNIRTVKEVPGKASEKTASAKKGSGDPYAELLKLRRSIVEKSQKKVLDNAGPLQECNLLDGPRTWRHLKEEQEPVLDNEPCPAAEPVFCEPTWVSVKWNTSLRHSFQNRGDAVEVCGEPGLLLNLYSEGRAQPLFCVTGPSGCGKTMLCATVACCERAPSRFPDGVFVGSDIDALLHLFGVPYDVYCDMTPQTAASTLKGIMRCKTALLVVDDVTDTSVVSALKAVLEESYSKCLINTTQKDVADMISDRASLTVEWDTSTAAEYFKNQGVDTGSVLADLTQVLERSALLHMLSGRLVAAGVDAETVLARLQDAMKAAKTQVLLRRKGTTELPTALFLLISFGIEALPASCVAALSYLSILCDPNLSVPIQLLQWLCGLDQQELNMLKVLGVSCCGGVLTMPGPIAAQLREMYKSGRATLVAALVEKDYSILGPCEPVTEEYLKEHHFAFMAEVGSQKFVEDVITLEALKGGGVPVVHRSGGGIRQYISQMGRVGADSYDCRLVHSTLHGADLHCTGDMLTELYARFKVSDEETRARAPKLKSMLKKAASQSAKFAHKMRHILWAKLVHQTAPLIHPIPLHTEGALDTEKHATYTLLRPARDNRRMFGVTQNRTSPDHPYLTVWDTSTRKVLKTIQLKNITRVTSMAVLEGTVAVGDDQGGVTEWVTNRGIPSSRIDKYLFMEMKGVLLAQDGRPPVHTLWVNPENSLVGVRCDGEVVVKTPDAERLEIVPNFRIPEPAGSVVTSLLTDLAVTTRGGNTITVHSIDGTTRCKHVFSPQQEVFTHCSNSSPVLAAALMSGIVTVFTYNGKSLTFMKALPGHGSVVRSMCLLGASVATLGRDGVRVWDGLKTYQCKAPPCSGIVPFGNKLILETRMEIVMYHEEPHGTETGARARDTTGILYNADKCTIYHNDICYDALNITGKIVTGHSPGHEPCASLWGVTISPMGTTVILHSPLGDITLSTVCRVDACVVVANDEKTVAVLSNGSSGGGLAFFEIVKLRMKEVF